MNTSNSFWRVVLVVCLFAFASVAVAKPERLTTIDYPGAVHTYALGINPAGDIVGAYVDTLGREHGFALRNGQFISFDWPGSTWTDGYGINPRGDIVGQYGWIENGIKTTHGFLLKDGALFPVDVPGQQNTMPFKINPEGMIVGCNHTNLTAAGAIDISKMYGFTLDAAGATSQTIVRSMNLGVNPAGDVVGYYFGTPSAIPSSRAEWSYLIRNGVTTWFQYPGAFATLATDISPSGTIVGRYRLQTPATFHGFVLEDDVFESFDVPGATQTFPFSVSATGDIVGYYVVGAGSAAVAHGFLLSRRGPG